MKVNSIGWLKLLKKRKVNQYQAINLILACSNREKNSSHERYKAAVSDYYPQSLLNVHDAFWGRFEKRS